MFVNPQRLPVDRYDIALKQMATAIRRRGLGGGYWQRWGEHDCPIEYPTNALHFSTTIDNQYDDYADDYYEQEPEVDEYADLEKFEQDEEYISRFRPRNPEPVRTVINSQSASNANSPVQAQVQSNKPKFNQNAAAFYPAKNQAPTLEP